MGTPHPAHPIRAQNHPTERLRRKPLRPGRGKGPKNPRRDALGGSTCGLAANPRRVGWCKPLEGGPALQEKEEKTLDADVVLLLPINPPSPQPPGIAGAG